MTRLPVSSFSQNGLGSALRTGSSAARSATRTRTGGCASTALRRAEMCSGVVPQQPPRITAPGSAAICSIFSVKYSGVPWYTVLRQMTVGLPAFGMTIIGAPSVLSVRRNFKR